MVRDDDKSLENTIEALRDLTQLLHLSHEAALRLKQNVPGQDFPTAYKLAKKLKLLQNAVEAMQSQMDPRGGVIPGSKPVQDLISSSDQLT
ncbi:hypothetical protein [Thiohalophilus sp.]|uniref:hypothetical protein n=1 Tax=Thiohalophilus sp. TaxID=3028392 RepID=UPI00397716E0